MRKSDHIAKPETPVAKVRSCLLTEQTFLASTFNIIVCSFSQEVIPMDDNPSDVARGADNQEVCNCFSASKHY